MNRLSPLIARRAGPLAPVYVDVPETEHPDDDGAGIFEDLKLFAITWLGGLVFFGTLFG